MVITYSNSQACSLPGSPLPMNEPNQSINTFDHVPMATPVDAEPSTGRSRKEQSREN